MNEADLLIVLGASFSDHTGIEPSKPIIQIDRDPMMLAKRHPVTLPVMGDVGVAAMQLKGALESLQVAGTDQRGEIGERWAMWRQEKATRVTEDNGRGLPAAALFAALTRLAPKDAIIAVDVGNKLIITHDESNHMLHVLSPFKCSHEMFFRPCLSNQV